jgi:hypothetical protein
LLAQITGDGVPDDVIVEWVRGLYGQQLPYNERIARAAGNLARTMKDEELRGIGFVFAHMRGDETVAAVTALQQSITNPHHRELVGVGMMHSESTAGRAIGERACKHPKVRNDAVCRNNPPSAKPTDLAGRIEYGDDAKTLLAEFSRADVLAALTNCTETGRDYRPMWCFMQIADIDRARAVALAKQFTTSSDERLAKAARSLLKYPDLAVAERALVELGFKLDKARDADANDSRAPLTLQDLLVARGRSEWFDGETGMFPNEHDGLLTELAALARPVLDSVVFEEIPPEEDAGKYTLRAYLDEDRYSLVARNLGDWYDVEAVVGLVNALLVAKQSTTRLVTVPTGDQTVIVVAGPAHAIKSLVDEKLLELGEAGESERVGKESEDRVIEALEKEGETIMRDVRLGN